MVDLWCPVRGKETVGEMLPECEAGDRGVGLRVVGCPWSLWMLAEKKPGVGVELVREVVRGHVAPLDRDRSPGPDAETIVRLIDEGALDAVIARNRI